MVSKSSIYFLAFLIGFKSGDCSRKYESSLSPHKQPGLNSFVYSAASAVASSPLRVDLASLADVAANLVRSPLRVIEKKTKMLALDFGSKNSDLKIEDSDSTDDELSTELFYPTEETIFTEESWNVPLNECGNLKNVMNLETKMKDIRKKLIDELFDHASSFSWVSNAKTVSNYVSVVSVSLSQLAYLTSRLKATQDCPPHAAKKLRENVVEHLKTLTDFSINLRSHSGATGLALPDNRVNDPTKYFEYLLFLRDELGPDFEDLMLENFVEFIFEAYASAYPEKVTKIFLDYTKSDRWIPLPINYLRNRFLIENREEFSKFVNNWKVKAFGDQSGFDTRHLVNLGHLMQQGMISYTVFESLMDLTMVNGHPEYYTFDGNLIKFLTLMAATPYLLPSDPEIAILIGNFASPHLNYIPFETDSEKFEAIVGYWRFFTGSARGFSTISEENFTNLCNLIQKLDKVYPGISELLWSTVEGFDVNGFFSNLESNMISFKECGKDYSRQIEFIEANFTLVQTVDNHLADAKSFYLILEFFTDLLSDISDVSDPPSEVDEYTAYRKILEHCNIILESLLSKHVNKAMIAYWYEEKNYFPTGLFSALNQLWSTESCGFLAEPSRFLWDNLVELVDYNEAFAVHIMRMIISNISKSNSASIASRLRTPKCLMINGKADALNYELLHTILEINNDGILTDDFFIILSTKLAFNEISFRSAELLLRELDSNSSISFNMKGAGYVNFWRPTVVTNILGNDIPVEDVVNTFRIYLKIYRIHCHDGLFDINAEFLRNISTFFGIYKYVWGQVNSHAPLIGDEIFSQMNLSPTANAEELRRLALVLNEAFYKIIVDGAPLKSIRKLFDKLLEVTYTFYNVISKISDPNSPFFESDEFAEFVYSYNMLLFSIIRIPAFVIPDEEKNVLAIFDVLRNLNMYLPHPIENLIANIKTSSSLNGLYSKMLNYGDVLPAAMFDNPLLKDKKQIRKFQSKYVNFMISDASKITHNYFTPIIGWVKSGKMDPDLFIKLLAEIKPETSKSVFYDYLPVILEFSISPHYQDAAKIKALNTAFSEENDEFIRDLSNRRNWIIHDFFLEIFMAGPWGLKFLESCKDAIWYEGLMTEIERTEKQKFEESTWNTANFSVRAAAYTKEYLELIQTPRPNYYKRSELIMESENFIEVTSGILPILRDSVSLKNCYIAVSNWKWEIADGMNCFFRVFGEAPTEIKLLVNHIRLFHKTPRKFTLFNLILESIRTTESRVAVITMLPKIFKTSKFVLCESVLSNLYKWFKSDQLEGISFESFVANLIETAFEMAHENISVLDELFSVFNEVLSSKKSPQIPLNSRLHSKILDHLVEFKPQLLKLSCIMKYLRLVIERYSSKETICMQVMNILKDIPEFYLSEKMDWIIIWKQLHQSLQFAFLETKSLNVFFKLGNHNKFEEWRSFVPILSEMKLPANVLIKLVDEISEAERFSYELETVLMLPRRLKFEDFESFVQVERIVDWISKIIRKIEGIISADDFLDELDFPTEILKKLLLLIDFEIKIGGNSRNWTWRQIFRFVAEYEHHEKMIVDLLLNRFPDLIKQTTDASSIIPFIYELKRFSIDTDDPSYVELMSKCVMIYDKFSNSESELVFGNDLSILKESTLSVNADDLDVLYADLLNFRGLILNYIQEGQRQDHIASLGFDYIFQIIHKLFSDFGAERNEKLVQVCDLIVEILYVLLNSGENLISMAKSLDINLLECFVLNLSDIVRENIEKYSYLIGQVQKFALDDVSESFYYQIVDGTFRVDVCFITPEVIKNYDDVTVFNFRQIDESEWLSKYVEGIINDVAPDNSETVKKCDIDPKHFDMIELLIAEVNDDDLSVLFEKLTVLLEYHFPVLSFVERLLDKEEMDTFYENFMTDKVTEMLLNLQDPQDKKRFIDFIKNIQKIDSKQFETWKMSQLQPQIRNRLVITLQEAEDLSRSALFTAVARRMINKIEEFSDLAESSEFSKLVSSLKSLKVETIDPEVCLDLYNKFIDKLTLIPNSSIKTNNSWIEILRNSIGFLLTFPVNSSTETNEKLYNLAVRFFTSEIFSKIIDRAENSEDFRGLIEKFSSKIDAEVLKAIKTKLVRFGFVDDFGILMNAAMNSEPALMIEYLQNLNNLNLETRLRLLSFCRKINGFEKVSRLINYYKNVLSSHPEEKEMILIALLENNSVLSCFTSPLAISNKTNVKNKSSLIGILWNNLNHRKAISLVDRINNHIGKLLINLYFRASSWEHPLLDDVDLERDGEMLKGFLINYLASIKEDGARNRTSMYLKAFKLYERIESKCLIDNSVLIAMTDGLHEAIKQRDIYISSSSTVYAVYKFTRRLSGKKKERYFIMKKLLVGSVPRRDCFIGFLKAQLDSASIDWELHKELAGRLTEPKNQRIRLLLDEFEAEHRI